MTSVGGLRADAQRNRDLIVAAATEAFTEQGLDVPMEDLAQRAGVGVGTLYRRFPDRDALVLAVVQENMARSIARTKAIIDEGGSAWDRLVRCLDYSPELQITLRLSQLVESSASVAIFADDEVMSVRRTFSKQITNLVREAHKEGSLRSDVGAGDVMHLFSTLLRSARTSEPGVYERLLAIVLDGLRSSATTKLPGRPLSADRKTK